jgi:hypothetical protein
MAVKKKDDVQGQPGNGQPFTDPNTAPSSEQPPITESEPVNIIVKKAVEKARGEEKAKLYSELGARDEKIRGLEARLTDMDNARKAAEEAGMKPDERLNARMNQLEATAQAAVAQANATEQAAMARIQAAENFAYRERALRMAGPDIIPELVGGSSPQEIDDSIEVARAEYRRMEQLFYQRFQQQHQLAANPPQGAYNMQFQPVQQPGVAAVPPNPAFANPGVPGVFPTMTNPEPVAESGSPLNLRDLTSEEAVRSGRWGEIRQQILGGFNRTPYQGNIGSAPRHMTYQQLPGGIQQPMGLPTGPITPPNMYQQPYQQQQYVQQPHFQQQQPVSPVQTEQAAALAAVQRTHAGQNPLVSGDGVTQAILNQAQAHGAQRGVNPQTAFQQRFQPTPPIQQPPQQ